MESGIGSSKNGHEVLTNFDCHGWFRGDSVLCSGTLLFIGERGGCHHFAAECAAQKGKHLLPVVVGTVFAKAVDTLMQSGFRSKSLREGIPFDHTSVGGLDGVLRFDFFVGEDEQIRREMLREFSVCFQAAEA